MAGASDRILDVDVSSVTVGVPVSNLDRSIDWYTAVLSLESAPRIDPDEGVVEFQVGTVWLQLGVEPNRAGGGGAAVRFGVGDVDREHQRLTSLGLPVTDIETVPHAVKFFDITDPDGNQISLYTELD